MSKNKNPGSLSRIQKKTASRLTLAPYKQLIILLSLLKDTNISQTTQVFSYVEQHKIQNILCSRSIHSKYFETQSRIK